MSEARAKRGGVSETNGGATTVMETYIVGRAKESRIKI